MSRQIRFSIAGVALAAAVLMAAAPAEAQREFEPLFDKFNFKAEFSWVALNTQIRLDSEVLGRGTTLNFEDDLNLGSNEAIPTLAFEWQIAKKHRLGVRWQDISRGSSTQALTEIQWGDETIPIDADIGLGFDINQLYLDYTYYPWVKEKWAAGFGIGFRVMEIQATLSWASDSIEGIDGEGSSDVKGTAPLPYLYFDYRRLFGEKWRMNAGLGWLYVEHRRHLGRPVDRPAQHGIPCRTPVELWCRTQSLQDRRRLGCRLERRNGEPAPHGIRHGHQRLLGLRPGEVLGRRFGSSPPG